MPSAILPGRREMVTGGGRLVFVPPVLASLVGLMALIVSPTIGMFMISATTIVWAVWVTLTRGHWYLTPSCIWAISAGVFLGAASLYLGILGSDTAPMGDIRDVASLTLFTTVAVDAIATAFSIKYRTSWPERRTKTDVEGSRGLRREFQSPTQFELKAIVIIAISKVPAIVALGDSISPALGLVGVLMICLGLSSIRQRIRWAGDYVVAVAAILVPALWISTVFTGYGRLTLAGLGFAVLAAWSLTRPAKWHKVALLIALPGLLLAMGAARRDLQNNDPRRAKQAATVGAGLESVYNPIETLAVVVDQPDLPGGKAIGPRYGATFVNTLLLPVPRSWWEGKPKGFGAELTEAIRPDLLYAGHSMAALSNGEWYANFGFVGLGMMSVALGWVIARCDRWHARLAWGRLSDPSDWYSAVTLLCIMSSIGELYWVGTFTFFNRGGLAAVFAFIISKVDIRQSRPSVSRPELFQTPVSELGTGPASAGTGNLTVTNQPNHPA